MSEQYLCEECNKMGPLAQCERCEGQRLAKKNGETRQELEELRTLSASLLDAVYLRGHVMTADEHERLCLLTGRYCSPYLDNFAALEASGFSNPCSVPATQGGSMKAEDIEVGESYYYVGGGQENKIECYVSTAEPEMDMFWANPPGAWVSASCLEPIPWMKEGPGGEDE